MPSARDDFLSQKLKIARHSLKKNQKDMAKDIGISHSNYSSLERGKTKPSQTTLDKITQTFELPENFFTSQRGELEEADLQVRGNLLHALYQREGASEVLTSMNAYEKRYGAFTPFESPEEEKAKDYWRNPKLHAFRSANCMAVKGYEDDKPLIVCGPTRCGKTLTILEWLVGLHMEHPKFQSLIIRSDAVDLTDTIKKDLRDVLLKYDLEDPLSPVTARRGTHEYTHLKLNRGMITFLGMNRPGKVLGTDFDFVFYNQIEQSTEEHYQKLITRSGGTAGNWRDSDGKPRAVLIGDANPDTSDHYLLRYKESDKVNWIDYEFEDNPLFFRDGERTEDWSIVEKLDERLEGIWHDRYFKNLWVSPEGCIFELEDCHFIEKLPEDFVTGWTHYNVMDFGMDDPNVCLWIAKQKATSDVIVYQEWRKVKTDIIEMGESVKAYQSPEHKIARTIIDNDENRQRLLSRECGIPSVMARKGPGSIQDGIDLISNALKKTRDGQKGGLRIYRNLRCNSDPALAREKLVPDVITELRNLVYDSHGKPHGSDHGVDCIRYFYLWDSNKKVRPWIPPMTI